MKEFIESSQGDEKVKEYINRIKAGENKEEIFNGLPASFRNAIETGMKNPESNEKINVANELTVPPQYAGLPSFVLEEIWTIPIYEDSEKTRREMERKQQILEMLRQKEIEMGNDMEIETLSAERVEQIKQEMGITDKLEQQKQETPFNKFSVANGETDTGVFWYQYRNQKAKELKAAGQFEWGKERLYFDIKMEDLERLRDLMMHVAGEHEIAIAFKYLDEKQTIDIQKDGSETRFVANFATELDAKKFLLALKNTSEYTSFVSDRNLNYNGIRIDGIAEYASGFREGRAALERIMQGTFNDDKIKYIYKSESGKDIILAPEQYASFREQYEKLSNEIALKRQEWTTLFQ